MKEKKHREAPNFVLKETAGRIKRPHKKDGYVNEGLRIVENAYDGNIKHGVMSLVFDSLEEYEEELEELNTFNE